MTSSTLSDASTPYKNIQVHTVSRVPRKESQYPYTIRSNFVGAHSPTIHPETVIVNSLEKKNNTETLSIEANSVVSESPKKK